MNVKYFPEIELSFSSGIARRNCFRAAKGGPQWGVPDLSQCISDEMATIAQQVGLRDQIPLCNDWLIDWLTG